MHTNNAGFVPTEKQHILSNWRGTLLAIEHAVTWPFEAVIRHECGDYTRPDPVTVRSPQEAVVLRDERGVFMVASRSRRTPASAGFLAAGPFDTFQDAAAAAAAYAENRDFP